MEKYAGKCGQIHTRDVNFVGGYQESCGRTNTFYFLEFFFYYVCEKTV